jgi:hypothetical protein
MKFKLFSYYPNVIHLFVYYYLLILNIRKKIVIVKKQAISSPILIIDTLSGDKENSDTIKSQALMLKSNIQKSKSQFECNQFILEYTFKSFKDLRELLAKKRFSEIYFLSPNICLNLKNFGFLFSYKIAKRLKQVDTKVVICIWDAYDIGTLIFLEMFGNLDVELVSLCSNLENVDMYTKFKRRVGFKPIYYLGQPNLNSSLFQLKERKFDTRVPNLDSFDLADNERDYLKDYLFSNFNLDSGFYENYDSYMRSLNSIKFVVVFNELKKRSFGKINQSIFTNTKFFHAVGRNFEALNAGCLLFTQSCKEIESIFTHNVNAVIWSDVNELVRLIEYYSRNTERAQAISVEGMKLYDYLFQQQFKTT